MALFYNKHEKKVLPSVAGKIIPMPSFSQLRLTLRNADYLNNTQEIIFPFLSGKQRDIYKGYFSLNDFRRSDASRA